MTRTEAKESAGTLNTSSLREQVYHRLREEMYRGSLLPGETLNPNKLSQELGISKTPLRDALIQLECEGFVTILPRRGILVKKLTLDEVRHSIEIVGALEASALGSVFDLLEASHLEKMEQLNAQIVEAIHQGDYDRIYVLNIAFHDVFLALSDNETLKKIIMPIKQRLYDFPRRAYIREWELINCDEHAQLIDIIAKGDRRQAESLWRDSHWSFSVHEKYIRRFYFSATRQIEAQLDNGHH